MDGHRCDDLTKALAAGISRRRVLKGLLGGAAAGAMALLGRTRGADAARPRPNGATCIRNDQCQSGLCNQQTRRCEAASIMCEPFFEFPCGTMCCDAFKEFCNGTQCVSFSSTSAPADVRAARDGGGTLPYAPDEVWQALIDPATFASVLKTEGFAPRVGQRFRFLATPRNGFDGVMEAELVAFDAPRRLAFTWRGGSLAVPTTVTITLEPADAGTRLRMEHTTPDGSACEAARQLLGGDWTRSTFGRALPRQLARTRGGRV